MKYLRVVKEHSIFQNLKFSIIIIVFFFVVSQTNNSAINDLIFFALRKKKSPAEVETPYPQRKLETAI